VITDSRRYGIPENNLAFYSISITISHSGHGVLGGLSLREHGQVRSHDEGDFGRTGSGGSPSKSDLIRQLTRNATSLPWQNWTWMTSCHTFIRPAKKAMS
jgi:hypothetical protein